jgi:hypothetical protein
MHESGKDLSDASRSSLESHHCRGFVVKRSILVVNGALYFGDKRHHFDLSFDGMDVPRDF